jgi:glucosamine--fructose-6-phosphate aminotransferase (isomerizing)
LNVYKAKGKVADLEAFCADKDISGHVGIAHTRWATHGEPSAVNAHPHYSSSKNLAMIHNGIIENYADIKKNLMAKGVEFKSETDTEAGCRRLPVRWSWAFGAGRMRYARNIFGKR